MAVEQKAYPHPHVNDAWLARLREDALEPDLAIIDAHLTICGNGRPAFICCRNCKPM